jgi:hypothetical protein
MSINSLGCGRKGTALRILREAHEAEDSEGIVRVAHGAVVGEWDYGKQPIQRWLVDAILQHIRIRGGSRPVRESWGRR